MANRWTWNTNATLLGIVLDGEVKLYYLRYLPTLPNVSAETISSSTHNNNDMEISPWILRTLRKGKDHCSQAP